MRRIVCLSFPLLGLVSQAAEPPTPAVSPPVAVKTTATFPGTVVPTKWSQLAPNTPATPVQSSVPAPMPTPVVTPHHPTTGPVAPSIGPISQDCNGRVVGCPCDDSTRLFSGNPFGRFLGFSGRGTACESGCSTPATQCVTPAATHCVTPSVAGPICRPRLSVSIDVQFRRDCLPASDCGSSRSCWDKLTGWLGYHPCYTNTLRAFRPTPYHAPLQSYFPKSHEPVDGSCTTGNCGPKCHVKFNRSGRLSSLFGFFTPGGFGFSDASHCGTTGEADNSCCQCKPVSLRYANPCCVPAGSPLTASMHTGMEPAKPATMAPAPAASTPEVKPASGVSANRPYTVRPANR
jgi:hypothetical protein